MNRLERNAWIELAAVTFCMAVIGLGLARLVRSNAGGLAYLAIGLIGGLPALLLGYLQRVAEQKRLGEREKQIAQKAFTLAAYTFVTFFGCSAFILFFIVGGAGQVPVYTLPAIFVGGFGVAQFTESAAILIQFAREKADE